MDKLNLGAETVNNVELSVRQSDRYQFVCGDYKNEQLVTDLLQSYEVDLVVNFAAESNVDVSFAHPAETFANNVNSLMGLLESCWQHGSLVKFVHISTDEVYGESGWGVVAPKVESDPFKPTNPYAISKTAAEQLVNYYRLTANLPVVIVRMNNVFGPRQDGTKVTPKFIQQISRGQLVTIQVDN